MQAEFNSKSHVKNLPDAYKKTTDSNNFKILEIERIACQDLRSGLQEVSNILDINNATGKTLDYYGERVGQARGVANDVKYLLMIKAKIMRNISNGSYQSIADALCMTFGCEPSQILIVEGEEPCSVKIVTLPLEIINSAGLTISQTLALVQSMLPVGTNVSSFLFEGSFEFGTAENEYDEEKGFADDAGVIGGFFGATGADITDEILPI